MSILTPLVPRAFNAEINRIVARQTELRQQIDVIVADLEGEES